jgi:hypothetical protein
MIDKGRFGKRIWKKVGVAYSRYYPEIHKEKPRINMEELSVDSQCPG